MVGDDRLRIRIVDSWHTDASQGSGTAVGIRGLVAGLSRLGHDLEVVRPTAPGRPLPERIAFNLGLDRLLGEPQAPDLVVGIDLDGFFWSRLRDRGRPVSDAEGRPSDVGGGLTPSIPAYVVCLKGVAADEARFETGAARSDLETLARFERLNASRADRVIVPSRYSAEVALRVYGLAESRIGIVPEPVGPPRRSLDRSTDPKNGRTILSVARQYPRKDTATLLRAMAILLENLPDARLRIVGDGPTLADSKTLARRLGIAGSVAFLGALATDGDVHREYRCADVFCLPSLQEGFGIAFVEAMTAGLPVVAARAGAVPEVVREGDTGILVPKGDPAGLARALATLFENSELRARMGAAGMDRAERYEPEPVARAFLAQVGFPA